MRIFKGSRQSGFGIGTVLIVVIVFAAVVAAISAATKSGGIGSFFGETDRIYASTVISVGSDVAVALQRAFTVGHNANTITLENPPEEEKLNLFDRKNGYLKRPQIPSGATENKQTAFLDLTIQPVFGDTNSEQVLVIYPLAQNVCNQINNIVSQAPLDKPFLMQPTVTIKDFLTLPDVSTPVEGRSTSTRVVDVVDAGASFIEQVNGVETEIYEGCATLADNIRIYYRVL